METKGRKSDKDFIHSKSAWIVAAWRYNHQTSQNREVCSEETGLPLETVMEWWDGVDRIYRRSGGSHTHFSGVTIPERVENVFKEILGNK